MRLKVCMLIVTLCQSKKDEYVWDRKWGKTGVYHHVPLAFECIYGCSNGGGEDRDGKEGRE